MTYPMSPRCLENGKWYIEVEAEGLGKVLLLQPNQSLPIPVSFDSEDDALEYIQMVKIKETTIDKEKITKWIKEEIYGCNQRKENERELAMRELLLKIERGYFDFESTTTESGKLAFLDFVDPTKE